MPSGCAMGSLLTSPANYPNFEFAIVAHNMRRCAKHDLYRMACDSVSVLRAFRLRNSMPFSSVGMDRVISATGIMRIVLVSTPSSVG